MLRFAQVAATTGAGGAAVGLNYLWNNKSAYEKDSCADYENDAFHDCFLLVTANWTVIFSRLRRRSQGVRKPLIVRNS